MILSTGPSYWRCSWKDRGNRIKQVSIEKYRTNGTTSAEKAGRRTKGTASAVKFQDMLYRLSLDILYTFCLQICSVAVAEGRESGKRVAFSKAAEPPSFPSLAAS